MYNQIVSAKKRLGDEAAKNSLGSSERLTYFKSKSKTPGPGEYLAPTAFGHYMAAKVCDEVIMEEPPRHSKTMKKVSRAKSLIQEYEEVIKSAKTNITRYKTNV